jgi:GT2 family glycosyltransferase
LKPRVTVIVVSWNALGLLQKCLPSVVASRYPNFEVVLADNGSSDGSAEWVEKTFPDVRVLRHGANLGFCAGNNRALEQTEGDYAVLLNNDVEVDPDWIAHLVDAADSDPRIAAAQPKLLQFDNRTRFEYAGAAGGHLDRFGYPFARGRVFFDLEEDTGQYDQAADIFWATGAALLLRRSALDEVGLLDEAFEFHMEEIDLCWRLRSAGYRIVVAPLARAFHVGGGSLSPGSPRKTRYNFRNSLLMLYKNLPPRAWRRVFPVRLLLDGLAAVRFLGSGQFRQAGAVFAAYADAHQMKGAYTQPREDTVPTSYEGSIVWDYWARGRKKFSDLDPARFRLP